MDHRENGTLFFDSVHVETGKESKKYKGYHYQCDFAMDAGHKKSVPIDTNHGNASRHPYQQYTKCQCSQVYMPLPLKMCLLFEMKYSETLESKIKYITRQHYC
jgi:hypothetical protein